MFAITLIIVMLGVAGAAMQQPLPFGPSAIKGLPHDIALYLESGTAPPVGASPNGATPGMVSALDKWRAVIANQNFQKRVDEQRIRDAQAYVCSVAATNSAIASAQLQSVQATKPSRAVQRPKLRGAH